MSNISLQRTGGNIASEISNNFDASLSTAGAYLQGMIDSADTFFSNIWGGGFVGIKDFGELRTAFTNYAAGVQAAVDEYNESADISSTVKGKAADGLQQFVVSTKELLRAYATLVKSWEADLDKVAAAYDETTTNINSNVSSQASEVSQLAKSISLD